MSRNRTRELPRVLSVADARAAGLTRSATRNAIEQDGWRPLTRGVVLTRDEAPTREDWIHVGLHLTGPSGALSGWDAVRILGLGARRPPRSEVLVLARGGRHRTVGGVHVRPTSRPFRSLLLPGDHPTLPYVAVAQAARAIADTALLYKRFDPVRAMVTSVIQKQVCTPAQLLAELDGGPRQHSYWLRRALEDILIGAKSIAEAEAVEQLTRARVPTFEVNVPIMDRWGRVVAEADLLWRELRMIAEVDSREFHFSEAEWKGTTRRHTFLSRHGFAIEHHPPSDIRVRGGAWAAGVASGLRARAIELGVPYVRGRGPRPVPPGGHPPIVLT